MSGAETLIIEDRQQQVIGRITEARARLSKQAERAEEVRTREDLSDAHKQAALDEIIVEASTRVRHLIRDARGDISSGHVVGASGGGTPIRSWHEGLSADGLQAVSAMAAYIDAAELVFDVDLFQLETGEAPSTRAAADRDTAAREEVAAFEDAHSAPPEGVPSARDRWSTIG